MNYQLHVRRSAERDLNALHGELFNRIDRKIRSLADNPRPFGVQKLRDQAAYRLRVGDYRIMYLIDDAMKVVDIFAVRHRRDAYR